MNKARYLVKDIEAISFAENKMAFVSGPRQAGKTTMAKLMLDKRGYGAYCNWDEMHFRKTWVTDPSSIIPTQQIKKKALVILDEIHKAKLWKRNMKGIYDTLERPCDIIVTGSARLNIYRKGSDSLLGRYDHYRLHPFSISEMLGNQYAMLPEQLMTTLLTKKILSKKIGITALKQIQQFGPFPTPLFTANQRRLNLWRRNRTERIIREDLRDLSRLPELSQIEMMVALLPDRVANPLSITSLSTDLEVAYATIRRWLNYLKELYYHYELKPYTKSLPRTLKKTGKLYLWDWSDVQNPGARYENLVASHLLKYCDYLTDTGYGKFELRYIKNKEGHEIDFLVLNNGKPWLPIEAKLSDKEPSKNWLKFMPFLKLPIGIQVVNVPNTYKVVTIDNYKILVISADAFLSLLI